VAGIGLSFRHPALRSVVLVGRVSRGSPYSRLVESAKRRNPVRALPAAAGRSQGDRQSELPAVDGRLDFRDQRRADARQMVASFKYRSPSSQRYSIFGQPNLAQHIFPCRLYRPRRPWSARRLSVSYHARHLGGSIVPRARPRWRRLRPHQECSCLAFESGGILHMRAAPGRNGNSGFQPRIQDFADTAAAIAVLDLVINIDTAVANLVGAFRARVRVAIPFIPDWRLGHGVAQLTSMVSRNRTTGPVLFRAMARDLAESAGTCLRLP
jgi:hypothetical protein